jgi:hypothetical protein
MFYVLYLFATYLLTPLVVHNGNYNYIAQRHLNWPSESHGGIKLDRKELVTLGQLD